MSDIGDGPASRYDGPNLIEVGYWKDKRYNGIKVGDKPIRNPNEILSSRLGLRIT